MWGEILVACASLIGSIIAGVTGHKLTAYRVEQLEKRLKNTMHLGKKFP